MNPWYTFLSKFQLPPQSSSSSQQRPTHVSMIHPKNKYVIPIEHMDEFFELYGSIFMDQNVGMLELMGNVLPVLVDIDLKKEVVSSSVLTQPPPPIFDFEFIYHMVRIYQKIVQEIFQIEKEEDVFCFILQKSPYLVTKNNRHFVKHGIHLHFPKIFCSKLIQEQELIPRVKLEYKKQAKFPSLSIDHFLDKSYCRGNGTPWLLYGGRKEIMMDPYLISHIITHEGQVLEHGEWQRFFLDQDYCLPLYSSSSSSMIDLTSSNLDFYLPRILSTLPQRRDIYHRNVKASLQPLDSYFSNLSNNPQTMVNSQIQRFSPFGLTSSTSSHSLSETSSNANAKEDSEVENIEMIDELMGLLSKERSEDRNEWMHVGWILHNVFHGSQEGFQRWIDFSKRSPELFEEKVCEVEWKRMYPKNITVGSLKYIAKKDNPEVYHEVMQKYSRVHIEKALKLNGTHHDLAKALFEKYEGEFACASIRDKVWFQFKGTVWERNEEGFSLRSKISAEIVEAFEELAMEFQQKLFRADKEEAQMYKKKVDSILRLIMHLKSAPYKTNVMKEAMEVFYQPKFFSKLDAAPKLFAFANGVMDLEDFSFRPGRPQDYLSVHAPIHYRTDFTMESPEVQQVVQFLEKIFPDQEVRQYFLHISSDIFIGGNTHKIVQFWSGEGDNGKSVTEKLFEKMLGSYSIKLPTSLIVGKRTQSSQACPELVRAGNGVRIAMLQEPDGKDVINIGILKELSGNDTFFARGLYRDGTEISPMFKLILICNEPPKIPGHDKATRNRIRVIPFESTFVEEEDAPKDPLEQLKQKKFPKDKDFMNKIPSMTEAFSWMLLQYLKQKPTHFPEPEKVKMATSNYLLKNDLYRQFCDESVMEEEGSELLLNDLYQVFKDWYHDSIPNEKVPNKSDLKDYLTKLWGPPTTSKERSRVLVWKGKALRGVMDAVVFT